MDPEEFRRAGHRLVDWMADYQQGVRHERVRASSEPGAIYDALPATAPEAGCRFEDIFADIERLILPGITHWQHPRFMAYFPANASPPSVLAEMLTAALGVNAMLWETSPAATELEERMIDWLLAALNLPANWRGVIQSTASEATFCALIMARDTAISAGVPLDRLCLYASADAHSSVAKAAHMAGLKADALRVIPLDGGGRMQAAALNAAVAEDRAAGRHPTAIVATAGTTSTGAVDPVADIAVLCQAEGIFLHIDAAWAGTAMLCPDYRALINGAEAADSFVFNPHKWLGVQFDCSVHFVRDAAQLTASLGITPEYLKTREDSRIVNYRDWGIPLGRRFRALKLWTVLRFYGLQALRERIRAHCRWARELHSALAQDPLVAETTALHFSLFCARLQPPAGQDSDAFQQQVLEAVNRNGFTYITKTRVEGQIMLRLQVGAWSAAREDVFDAWAHIRAVAAAAQADALSQR